MKVILIEDEDSVARNLSDLLTEIDPHGEILVVLETIREAVRWLERHPSPDIGFFDIKIADGQSFEIFERVPLQFPIIFTTAFDAYALKAFQYNSIDYLLKPINRGELERALAKYRTLYASDRELAQSNERQLQAIAEIKRESGPVFKNSFLVHFRNQLIPLQVAEIAYCYVDNQMVYCRTHSGDTYRMSYTMERLERELDPQSFFRANRQWIVAKSALGSIEALAHRKLRLLLEPKPPTDVLVGKVKAGAFKRWMQEDLG